MPKFCIPVTGTRDPYNPVSIIYVFVCFVFCFWCDTSFYPISITKFKIGREFRDWMNLFLMVNNLSSLWRLSYVEFKSTDEIKMPSSNYTLTRFKLIE